MSGSGQVGVAEVREAALRLLSRREHSVRELRFKLTGKGWPEAEADRAIEELAAAGLQSDRRFADSFVRQRAGRHYGPRRILAELDQRGIAAGLANAVIEEQQIDFAALAAEFYRRKYRVTGNEIEYKERAKRAQALYRRGFESEHLRDLI